MVYPNKRELIQKSIRKDDVVLDVGFWGQGTDRHNPQWPHKLLKERVKDVYGLDLELEEPYRSDAHYLRSSAENFSFPVSFDVIFAGDLIEHLSNPGMFLESCTRNLAHNGRVVLTTPNAFNLFNIAEKFSKREPTVNKDHTCYFNSKTLKVLLEKNGFVVESIDYLYALDVVYRESYKKKALNVLYWFASLFTDKFVETLVVTAVLKDS